MSAWEKPDHVSVEIWDFACAVWPDAPNLILGSYTEAAFFVEATNVVRDLRKRAEQDQAGEGGMTTGNRDRGVSASPPSRPPRPSPSDPLEAAAIACHDRNWRHKRWETITDNEWETITDHEKDLWRGDARAVLRAYLEALIGCAGFCPRPGAGLGV